MIKLDFGFWVYIMTGIIGGYGFLLFLWWWLIKKGHASLPYVYVMLLNLSVSITNFYMGFNRFQIMNGASTDILQSIYWEIRTIPMLVVLLLFNIHMTYRVVKKKDMKIPPDGKWKRRGDG